MGTVYKKTATKPIPNGADLFTKNGKRFARWKPSKGKVRTAPVTTGNHGTDRIVVTVGTYLAKFRDGSGLVCEVSTGCRDEDATRLYGILANGVISDHLPSSHRTLMMNEQHHRPVTKTSQCQAKKPCPQCLRARLQESG